MLTTKYVEARACENLLNVPALYFRHQMVALSRADVDEGQLQAGFGQAFGGPSAVDTGSCSAVPPISFLPSCPFVGRPASKYPPAFRWQELRSARSRVRRSRW